MRRVSIPAFGIAFWLLLIVGSRALAQTGEVQQLIDQWTEQDILCRGGAGDEQKTWEACGQRDAWEKSLQQKGWCYGKQGQSSAEMSWHSCGPASAQTEIVGLRMPSDNIYCMIEYGNVGLRCDIMQVTGQLPPKPASCPFAWGKAFEITPDGNIGTRLCVSDVVAKDTPLLAYGMEWNQSGYLCKSATTGLTCTNAKGHGFMLSKAVQNLF